MALFSTLLSSSTENDSSSLSSIPTVVQLYTSNALILDATAKAGGHAVLSYQAVEVGQLSTTDEGGDSLFGLQRKTPKPLNQNPNLGVWNCCVPKKKDGSLVDKLLGVPVDTAVPTFCFTVDLKDPSKVEPTMSALQEALVRHLIQNPPPQDKVLSTATTSLHQLRSAQFGLAPEDEESKVATVPNENDKGIKFALMVCAIVPPPSSSEGTGAYKEKQAQALLLYHLRRYAASVNATLCFVRTHEEPDGEEKESTEQPTMTPSQLANKWLQLARGEAVVKEEESPSEDSKEPEETAAYGPGTQEDLIETVLLRNAHCQGEWDASKDSLWKALPPAATSETEKDTDSTKKLSDDVWLSQLRKSIGSLMAAPEPAAPKETPKEAEKPQEKKEEDAAVSSFFESLLKKT